MGKRIAKKTGKGFLWLIKLGFVLLCLGIWWGLCIPLAQSILPAFYEQCVYHEFAKNFLREKYGENVLVYNQRLPLSEMNAANFMDYKYSFRLHGKTYQFLYAKYGIDDRVFYGDNVQSDELYQLVSEAVDKILYNNTMTDFDQYSWIFSEEVHPDSISWWLEIADTIFAHKYTGDNLHEFPICIVLYWDKEDPFDCNRETLVEIYTSVSGDLALYDVDCKEIHIVCTETKDYYYITKTSEGIKVEDKDYANRPYFTISQ
ncbi:MAG: hypothetical protein NC347_08805 [Clostridium sp.]|nr:hypothetical protein [Clostridium sp.]